MSKTKIDWCDEVWNPVWGCSFSCPFCYARKFAYRFGGQVARWNELTEEKAENLKNFRPTFLPKNFFRPFKGKIVFVYSMSDVADWKREWIEKVFNRILHDNRKDRFFLFLSKRPEIYLHIHKIIPLTEIPKRKVWFGTSVSTTEDFIQRSGVLSFLLEVKGWDTGKTKFFVSFEPLKEKISQDESYLHLYDWIIIGAQTNPLKLPHKEWVISLTRRAKSLNIPVFHKDNLKGLEIELLKEFPF